MNLSDVLFIDINSIVVAASQQSGLRRPTEDTEASARFPGAFLGVARYGKALLFITNFFIFFTINSYIFF